MDDGAGASLTLTVAGNVDFVLGIFASTLMYCSILFNISSALRWGVLGFRFQEVIMLEAFWTILLWDSLDSVQTWWDAPLVLTLRWCLNFSVLHIIY